MLSYTLKKDNNLVRFNFYPDVELNGSVALRLKFDVYGGERKWRGETLKGVYYPQDKIFKFAEWVDVDGQKKLVFYSISFEDFDLLTELDFKKAS
jgi:hypothetical protein